MSAPPGPDASAPQSSIFSLNPRIPWHISLKLLELERESGFVAQIRCTGLHRPRTAPSRRPGRCQGGLQGPRAQDCGGAGSSFMGLATSGLALPRCPEYTESSPGPCHARPGRALAQVIRQRLCHSYRLGLARPGQQSSISVFLRNDALFVCSPSVRRPVPSPLSRGRFPVLLGSWRRTAPQRPNGPVLLARPH